MDSHSKNKQLLKILIGAAWIDGIIQTQERDYLRRMAANHGLADDPDIKNLLSELKPVQPAECYNWLEDYFGDNHNAKAYQELLESLSALIYSDGDVQIQEAQLLTKLQNLDPGQEPKKSTLDKLLKTVQKLYRKAVSEQA